MERRTDRREFLATVALGAGALALGRQASLFAATPPVLVQVSGPGVVADVPAAVHALLLPLGGMGAFVKKGARVLLKPNLGFPNTPETRATTDPRVVAALAREALAAGASRVLVMDYPCRNPEAVEKKTGYVEALRDLDVPLILPCEEKFYVERELPQAKELKRTKVLREALEVDVHIAVPLAKSHSAAGFTGALKGGMGLIWDRKVFHTRFDLNEAVVDLFSLVRPQLTVLDGLAVMASGGPAGPGEVIATQALIASRDAVAADAAGVRLAPLYGQRIAPGRIKHLALAAARGLGTLEPPPEQVQQIHL